MIYCFSHLPTGQSQDNTSVFATNCVNCGHFFKYRNVPPYKTSVSFTVNGVSYTGNFPVSMQSARQRNAILMVFRWLTFGKLCFRQTGGLLGRSITSRSVNQLKREKSFETTM